MKNLKCLSVILFATLLFASCQNGNEADKYIGAWSMQEFNGEGTVTIANLGVVIDSKIIHISDDAVININEDGTILFTGQVIYNQEMYQGDVLMDSVSTTLDHDDSGTWTLDGDGKIITDVFGEAFTFRGDDLTMSQELDENYLNLGEDGAELGFEFDQTLTMKYSKK